MISPKSPSVSYYILMDKKLVISLLILFSSFMLSAEPSWGGATTPSANTPDSTTFARSADVDSVSVLEARKHYSFAVQYDQNKMYDDAIQQYRKSLSFNPHNAKAHYALGSIYHKVKGNTDAAKAAYLEAIKADSTHINAHLMLANIYHVDAQYDSAIREYETILAIEPEQEPVLRTLSGLYRYKGLHLDELAYLRKLSKLVEKDSTMLNRIGQLCVYLALDDEAIRTYKELLRLNPQNMTVLTKLAGLQSKMGYYEDALESYKTIAKIDSTSYATFSKIRSIAQKLGKDEDAIFALEGMVRIRPHDISSIIQLAEGSLKSGDMESAEARINMGLSIDPQNGHLRVLNGEYYLEKGKEDEAIREFTSALNDSTWREHAQQMIWSIRPAISEEEKKKLNFFKKGKKKAGK